MDGVLDEAGLAAWRAFIFAHATAVGRIERDFAAAGIVSLTWYDVLTALSEAPQHRLRLQDLANEVVLSRSGLTRLLDRIEAAGLIRREPAETDRRGAYAIITPDGEAAVLRAWPVYARAIARHFAGHLTDEEQRVLAAALRRVRQHPSSSTDEGAIGGDDGSTLTGRRPLGRSGGDGRR